MKLKRFYIVSCLFLLSGCGTILYGPQQKVPIHSEPAGAQVVVDGKEVGTTPTVVTLSRGDNHEIVLTQRGSPSKIIQLKKKINGAILGTILPGGLLFLTIDSSNGSMYTLTPEKVLAIFDSGYEGDLTLSCYFSKKP